MTWNPQQLESLYASVYARNMLCPTCGGALLLAPAREPDAVGWVECDACGGRHFVSQQNDPLRQTFRDYTDDESRALFAAERRVQSTPPNDTTPAPPPPTCPVDGTEMTVHLQRSLGLTSNATIRCRRCGREAKYVRKHG
jgi:ribosomal protein S14